MHLLLCWVNVHVHKLGFDLDAQIEERLWLPRQLALKAPTERKGKQENENQHSTSTVSSNFFLIYLERCLVGSHQRLLQLSVLDESLVDEQDERRLFGCCVARIRNQSLC